MIQKTNIFKGRDNETDLVLKIDGTVIDHNSITRVVLVTPSIVLDSQLDAGIFDWTDATKLSMKLGLTGLPIGEYEAKLVIYDVVHTHGLAYEPKLYLNVMGW